MKSKEVLEKTGITYRQLDYWCRVGILPVDDPTPGSGYSRHFEDSIVDKICLMVRISKVLGHNTDTKLLKKVFESYDRGFIDIGEGIILVWREFEVSS